MLRINLNLVDIPIIYEEKIKRISVCVCAYANVLVCTEVGVKITFYLPVVRNWSLRIQQRQQ